MKYALILTLCAHTPTQAETRSLPRALPLEIALKKASCGGRYTMLVNQIHAPEIAQQLGGYHHQGYRKATKELPAGYQVYLYPYWYIWRDDSSKGTQSKRRWGTEQLLGKPDTPQAGDIPTAWASKTPDDHDEWLVVEYEKPVVPSALIVHETYNPGALARVTAFRLTGEEVEVWKGRDPTPPDFGRGISTIPLKVSFKTNRLKIYLQSRTVQGWNEIDAVGLRASGEKLQWAKNAIASSTYAVSSDRAERNVPIQQQARRR